MSIDVHLPFHNDHNNDCVTYQFNQLLDSVMRQVEVLRIRVLDIDNFPEMQYNTKFGIHWK